MINDFLQFFPGAAYQILPEKKGTQTFPKHGPLHSVTKEWLQDRNKEGSAVHFSPNGMVEGFRDAVHVTHINAWYVDIDTKHTEDTKTDIFKRITSAPLEPSFVVETRNGYHLYFLAKDAEIDNFTSIAQGLVKYYKGDSACVDPSRVLRIPGFYHQKESPPFKIELFGYNPNLVYTEEEICEAFDIDLTPIVTPHKSATLSKDDTSSPFWTTLASLDNKTVLERLSGTKYVNGETFTFRKRSKSSLFIDVNGEPADAWIDENGMIGSGKGKEGGPTWIQWLKYYKHDYTKIANIAKSLLKDIIPQEVIEKDEESTPEIIQNIELKSNHTQDIAKYIIAYEQNTLCVNRETKSLYQFHQVTGHHEFITQDIMIERINYILQEVLTIKKNITTSLRLEVYEALLLNAIKINIIDKPYVATIDGLLHIETLEIIPAKIETFCPLYLPYTVEQMRTMPTPTWDHYTEVVLVDENNTHSPELKQLFMEMCGYYLSPVRKPHAIFFLIGKTRSGKGVFANGVLSALFGPQLISHLSLGNLTNNTHAPSDLIGKRLNICDEDESKYIENGILKKICAEDQMHANPKFKQGFSFVNRAKTIVLGNHSPNLQRLDAAMKERLYFIPFNHTVSKEQRDWDLSEKLKGEIGGIAWQFILGWQRLKANNYIFSTNPLSDKELHNLELDISSIHEWFEETFTLSITEEDKAKEQFYSSTTLFAKYKDWCGDAGRKFLQKRKFFIDIKSIIGKEIERPRINFQQTRGYYLVPINPDEDGD